MTPRVELAPVVDVARHVELPAADGAVHARLDVFARRRRHRPRLGAVRHDVRQHAARVVAHLDTVVVRRVQQITAWETGAFDVNQKRVKQIGRKYSR